jgi:hypothetical protein
VKGLVYGGQQPISGASVYMFAMSTTGSGQLSTSLLKNTADTQSGTYGYYVTTNAGGLFNIAVGDYACTSGQQVYLYSSGGDASFGVNSAAGLMAVLVPCGANNSFPGLPASVQIDEVTTVAAAYALAGFATDSAHISGPSSALAATDMANAAASAGNLASLGTGLALATTPAGNGTAPQTEINTLADILAACINSAGPSSSGCTTLFSNATNSSSDPPSDTATAAINIAHNPGANVAALYGLATPTAPFQPYLTGSTGYTGPNDWTIAVTYSSPSLNGVTGLAIDSSGNVWVSNYDGNSLTKFSSTGTNLSGTNGYTGGGLNEPSSIAIDGTGNVWVANYNGNSLSEYSPSQGKFLSPGTTGYTGGGLNGPFSLAIDGSGFVWVTDHDGSSVSKFTSAGVAVTGGVFPVSGNGLDNPYGIAIDDSGDAWVANPSALNGTTLSELTASGGAAGSSPYTGNGLNAPENVAIDSTGNVWVTNYNAGISVFNSQGNAVSGSPNTGGGAEGTYGGPYGIAIDGSNNVWVANYGPDDGGNPGSISEFNYSSGTVNAITGANGYEPGLNKPFAIAVDGSGNVWVLLDGDGTVMELVGAASPVATPLIPPPAPLTITTTSLPNGTAGTAYSATLAATGGTTPYTWSLTSGTLPTGLSLTASTGAIGGTPTQAVSATPLTFMVTDSGIPTQQQSANLRLTIASASGITVTVSPARGGITTTQTLSLTPTTTDGAGVNWSVTGSGCSGTGCGTFSAPSSLTGVPVTYTPPATAGVYTITATSISENTVAASAPVGVTDLAGVTTYHNDNSRDGANTHEYALTTSNVTTATFGKLFSCTVDGAIYTQPLWVPNLTVASAKHNVVFVGTTNDSLYAFDADVTSCTMLWHANLLDTAHGGTSGEGPVPSNCAAASGNDCVGQGSGDISPEVGVIGTPVIDPTTNTLYVVSKSVNASGPTFYQRLHAIDITTGNENFSGPANITATFPGKGDGGTTVTFSARQQNQRSGLALASGIVYVAWASHEDDALTNFHGWLIGYNASNLSQASVFNDTPNGTDGGVWMSGGAPAVDPDTGDLFLITGNGTFDANSGTNYDYGDSFLDLIPGTNSLTVNHYFAPGNQNADKTGDLDFGSGGATVLVDLPVNGTNPTHLVIGGGKNDAGKGNFFVLNRANLGGYTSGSDTGAWQQVTDQGNSIFATGAFWNYTYYLGAQFEPLRAWSLSQSTARLTAVTPGTSHTFNFPGATPSISSTGTNTNGIVWALDNSLYCPPEGTCGSAVLYAYEATNLGTELWDSTEGSGNSAGYAVKFTVPTVANGKVYVGTRGSNNGTTTPETGELDVYGLLPN